MSDIPLGLSANRRADMPPVRLRNMFYEKAPTNLETQVALFPRPRLKQFAVAGPGPQRGLYRQGGVIQERILSLSGEDLYRIEPSADGIGTPTLIGAVTGDGRMSAEGNATAVVLTAGENAYTTDGETIDEIEVPDDQHVIAVDTLNSYFLFQIKDSGRFYWSAIGGTTIDALDYATAESQPDNTTTLKVVGDELWLVGRLSLEPWQPTGDLDMPFQRINGRIFGIGCVSRDTCQKLSINGVETMAWVGADGKVYRLAPNPTPISDHALEEAIAKADATTLYATTARWIGREFYVLHIPGQGSYACDLSTGFWDEWHSFERGLFRGAVQTVGPFDQSLLGDDASGVVWELSDERRTDGDDPVMFEFTGLLETNEGAIRANSVGLDCSVGQTASPANDPMIRLSMSRDRGSEWTDWREEPLGRQGRRDLQVIWKRLGPIKRPGVVLRWQTEEPITVRKAKLNEGLR